MLTALFFRWLVASTLPVVAVPTTVDARQAMTARAPERLAEWLASADAIHRVAVRPDRAITFAITRGDQTFELVARIDERGEVIAVSRERVKPEGDELGGLSWLGDELANATAVIRLVPDEEGAVTIATDRGRRYMVIPGRGSGGANAAVEARWAAEWNH